MRRFRRRAPAHAQPVDGHAHRFIVEPPRAATSRGECATCHEVREFNNDIWVEQGLSDAQKARIGDSARRCAAERRAERAALQAEKDARKAMAAEGLT